MLDKPLIDKTFEPGSMENASIHGQIADLIRGAQSIHKTEDQLKRAQSFAILLNKLNIKYILLDETVSSEVFSRGVDFWGTYYYPDTQTLIKWLIDANLAEEVKSVDIPNTDLLKLYPNRLPLGKDEAAFSDPNKKLTIHLLKLKNTNPRLTFTANAYLIDSELRDSFPLVLTNPSFTFVQNKKEPIYSIFPFLRDNF